MSTTPPPATSPRTLAVDIGGTGIKAAVFESDGRATGEHLRIATPYPCPPVRLVEEIAAIAERLPATDRVGVGFPGLLRSDRVVWVNSLTRATPSGPVDEGLARQWVGFGLQAELAARLDRPVRVANDADVAALASVTGTGLECVVTLGTGLGFSLIDNGRLLPHLELSGAPFRDGHDFESLLGEAGRERSGTDAWLADVHLLVEVLRPFLYFDHLYLGGGNARLLGGLDLGDDVSLVGNVNGLLGGHLLWAGVPSVGTAPA
jgi:polyphosphate glucokinase